MSFRNRSWLALFVIVPGMLFAQDKGVELKKARVLIRDASDRATMARFGTTQDDYGSFIVVRLPATAIERARRAGLDVEVMDENIGLGAFRFDPERGAPQVPERFAENEHGPEPRYYLVQFRGPIRDEWVDQVRQHGIETLQYVPDNSLLVRATPAQIATASRGREVRWSGLYHPAYKLSDDLGWIIERPVTKVQAARQYYRVAVFRGADHGRVISEIVRHGGRVERTEDVEALYFRSLLVEIDTGQLAELAIMREICRIETWYPDVTEDERSNQIMAGNYSGTAVTATGYASFLTNRGVNGSGITVGVVDDGVDVSETHVTGRVTDSAALRRGATAGANGHGHHDAGIVAGQCAHADSGGFFYGSGMAPQAHLLNIPFLRSGYTGSDAVAQGDIVTTAAGNGQLGTVSTNSWGSSGASTTYGTREATFDALVHDASSATAGLQPLAIIFSAGNSGPNAGTLTSPKAAKNILVVGASKNYRPTQSGNGSCGTVDAANIDQWVCFSSRGPAADGRIRPDVSAPGSWIASALAGSDTLWGNIDANHRYSSGTSQAAPHVAGATALIQQWWKNGNAGQLPAPALSKAMIINGAVDPAADPAGFIPNNTEGWGRMNLANVINSGVPAMYNNQQNVLTTAGQTFSVAGTVGDAARPFRVTLVWSDAPGAAGANPALVNNLDLEVTVGGNTYKGNVFANGVSATGGTADPRNNVEAVHFPAGGVSGPFSVTVRLTSVGGDGAPGTGDATDQHFALVVFNGTTCASPLPPAPTAAPNGNGRIDVTWPAVSGATSYRVLRGTTNGGPYTQVGTPTAATFADTTVSAFVTYFYVVRSIGSCESANSVQTSATATGTIDPPTGVTAVLHSATAVALNWNSVSGATGYRVYRTANNATFTLLDSPTGTSFVDATAATNTAYLYRVRTMIGANESGDSASNKALATTMILTDPTLSRTTPIKAVHFTQLRSVVNLVRLLSNPGAGAFAFTDPTLSSAVPVRRVHLTELRSTLDAARALLGLPAFAYTDPTITSGATRVRFEPIQQLRTGAGTTSVPTPVTTQILLNPGFELGAVNWTTTAGVIGTDATTARSGSWRALMNGVGSINTDTVYQEVAIPAAATAATFSFWVNIDTDEGTTSVAYDTLKIEVLNSAGTLLQTLATYSNLNATGTYVQRSFNVLAYKGSTIRLRFTGVEDESLITTFLLDDTALNVTQ